MRKQINLTTFRIDPEAFVVSGSLSNLMTPLHQMFWLLLLIFFYDLMIGPQAQKMERICWQEKEKGNLPSPD